MVTLELEGHATVGDKDVAFKSVVLQKKFRMYLPISFQEDTNLAYRYSYYANRSKSPLGIAIRFAPVEEQTAKAKMIANYFGGNSNWEAMPDHPEISYRESVNSGNFLSIYTLRFAVGKDSGILFGCFNCDDAFKEDWRDVVLSMLAGIESI